MGSDFTIRPFETVEEFQDCVRFQEEIWGGGFSERVAVAILKVSQRLGGIASGAYDESGDLAGFVYGMTGVESGEVVHWSDMLAVRPELQNSGLGARLKGYQRDTLLAQGITRMHWTFDPLESKNAYLNLNKLGAVAREYVQDMYGQTDSPRHMGIGTDRLVPTWMMDSERVHARLVEGPVGTRAGWGRGRPAGLCSRRRGGSAPSGRAGPDPTSAAHPRSDSGVYPGAQGRVARGRRAVAARHTGGIVQLRRPGLRSEGAVPS